MRDEHLGQMIHARAAIAPGAVAFRIRRDDTYADVPWSEVTPRLAAIAAGLLSAAVLDDGACITIVGNTSMASCLVDFAALGVGLRTVPVYASLLPEEVGYMHVDTAAQLVVVENAAQLAKVRTLRAGFTFHGAHHAPRALAIRARIVVIDPSGLAADDDWESLAGTSARPCSRSTPRCSRPSRSARARLPTRAPRRSTRSSRPSSPRPNVSSPPSRASRPSASPRPPSPSTAGAHGLPQGQATHRCTEVRGPHRRDVRLTRVRRG